MSDLEDRENNLRDSKFLLDNQDSEQQQRFPEEDRLYMEMVVSATKSKRNEGSGPLEENGNEITARFLKGFPAQREEIKKCICNIREVADKIEKIHKDCTIATITASSAGATSGILTIIGLALAPVTAGASLILTGTGIGLGAAAATTGISASMCEHFMNSKESKKADELMKTCEEILSKCRENLKVMMNLDKVDFNFGFPSNIDANEASAQHFLSSAIHPVSNLPHTVKRITENVKALEANPVLRALTTRAVSTSGTGFKKREKTLVGDALAISNGGRVAGITFAVAALLLSVYKIAQDAIHLTEGAKAEMAAEIREKACNLEEILKDLNELYDELKDSA
ncbi:apolipoprotein L3-like isoform X3 [Sceloporus undulatus]|nr:apolipoprotein L3-like isoform X3 [Sceloporus undulatus]XP_042323777.1 apolipoprotein L3-like isoform X3 [Sceloporus undulatus]